MKKRCYPALIVAASFITTPSFAGGGDEVNATAESMIPNIMTMLQRLEQCTRETKEDVRHNAYLNGEKGISEEELTDRAKTRCVMLDPDWSKFKNGNINSASEIPD